MLNRFAQPLAGSSTASLSPAALLTPAQASQLLGVSVKTLATWRSTGRHSLPYIRCGARIRYQQQAIATWLNQRTQTATADQSRGPA
ncbi:MAG: helix-turn-helix domain-containing protein [Pseudomonas sp.]|nr:helix-turn-helix domain-containing protein [Pseudomonas sp.]PHR10902.1 MAG: excisionase [Sphingopyxis sp.]